MTTLNVTVKQTTRKGETGYTGTVALPGLKATQLARKDGQTLFPTTSALKTVARNTAKRLGLQVEYTEPTKKVAKTQTCCGTCTG
jgi:hypothetical protein